MTRESKNSRGKFCIQRNFAMDKNNYKTLELGNTHLIIASYEEQRRVWPSSGRHILAQYDDDSIVVYQAYRDAIGRYAARHQRFGGEFSFQRMSWIKPNFLWMMYRSGWGTKPDQEVTLAIRIKRSAFEEILRQSVQSSHDPDAYATREEWQSAIAGSQVRVQWDPDHGPSGDRLERRAIQLGLREEVLKKFACEWIVEILDISSFVEEQRSNVRRLEDLCMPYERVYVPEDSAAAKRLGIKAGK